MRINLYLFEESCAYASVTSAQQGSISFSFLSKNIGVGERKRVRRGGRGEEDRDGYKNIGNKDIWRSEALLQFIF